MYERIDFSSGDFVLVTLPMSQHSVVFQYRQELHKALNGQTYWLPEMDTSLFDALGVYYRRIAAHCMPAFDPAVLTGRSRHQFFICTDLIPAPHPEMGDRLVPGLPQIDRLLGLEYPTPVAPSARRAIVTSGNPETDLLADLLLTFKAQTPWLVEHYSLPYLSKLLLQAAQRQNPEAQKELQAKMDREFFEQAAIQEALKQHYRNQGIPIPEDF